MTFKKAATCGRNGARRPNGRSLIGKGRTHEPLYSTIPLNGLSGPCEGTSNDGALLTFLYRIAEGSLRRGQRLGGTEEQGIPVASAASGKLTLLTGTKYVEPRLYTARPFIIFFPKLRG